MDPADPPPESAAEPTPEADLPTSSAGESIRTFRLPYYSRLWGSNLIQFVCFQVLFLAMQWLVTSLTPLRSAVEIGSIPRSLPVFLAFYGGDDEADVTRGPGS